MSRSITSMAVFSFTLILLLMTGSVNNTNIYKAPKTPGENPSVLQAGLNVPDLPGFLKAGAEGAVAKDNLEISGELVYQGKKVPIKGNVQQLKVFFDALNNARSRKMRIAHWGDSIILGDIISENIRENLQSQFGGNGVGFVSMNTDDWGMRNSTRVSFSFDWKEASFVKLNPAKLPLGMNGSVYSPSEGSWVKFETGKNLKTGRYFTMARLIYSNAPAGGTVSVAVNGGQPQTVKLEQGATLKEYVIKASNGSSLKLVFNNCQSGLFYGVSFENDNGVYLDNFPIRGNAGVALGDLPSARLKEFNNLFNYKLLIVNFGVNVLSPEHTSYAWYEAKMERVISYLKENFPQTALLLITVGDKGQKKGTRFITDQMVPVLQRSQVSIAERTGIPYWNLFEAMGGESSIVRWVEMNPPLANKDYCHMTAAGGKVVGDLFTEALLGARK